MSDRNTRLARLDAGNGLNVNTKTGRCSALPLPCLRAGALCCGPHVLDGLQGMAVNVGRYSLALGHSGRVSALKGGASP